MLLLLSCWTPGLDSLDGIIVFIVSGSPKGGISCIIFLHGIHKFDKPTTHHLI